MAITPAQGTAIAGAASAGGGIISTAIGARMARQDAKTQMRFQERMANTAYGRAVADMRRAGLNPALAYSQGGASSPSGSMPSYKVDSGIAGGIEAALNAKLIYEQARKTGAEADVTEAGIPEAQTKAQFWTTALEVAQGVNKLIRDPKVQQAVKEPFSSRNLHDVQEGVRGLGSWFDHLRNFGNY